MTEPLRIERLRPSAQLPAYATSGAAGMDLAAAFSDGAPRTLAPGARLLVPTGLRIALPSGHEGQVRPRSGLAIEHGVTVVNAPGTIDEDYRGEVHVALVNLGDRPFVIEPGMRVAQLVVAPVTQVRIAEEAVGERETARASRGFGSTGV